MQALVCSSDIPMLHLTLGMVSAIVGFGTLLHWLFWIIAIMGGKFLQLCSFIEIHVHVGGTAAGAASGQPSPGPGPGPADPLDGQFMGQRIWGTDNIVSGKHSYHVKADCSAARRAGRCFELTKCGQCG